MTTKEKIIRKSLASVTARISKIDAILDECPASAIIELRLKAVEIMREHEGNHQKISELIGPMAKEEKRLFAIAKKQEGSKLFDEKIMLEREMQELITELFYVSNRN